MPAPLAAYSQRLADRRAEERRWSRIDTGLAYGRLVVFAVGALLVLAIARGLASPWLLLVPVVIFGLLMQRHDRVLRRRTAALRAIAFYQRGIARIEDVWAGTGESGDRFRDDHHLYANDLDLFGNGSLFQLLSIAATPAGEETLAGWLKHPAGPDEIRARQAAVAELTPLLDVRESLARAALDVRADVHSGPLLTWAEQPPQLSPPWLAWISRAFTAAAIATIAFLALTDDMRPLLVVLAAQSLFTWPQLRRIVHVLHGAEAVTRDLETLSRLLSRIESEAFEAPRLRELQQRLSGGSAAEESTLRRNPPHGVGDESSLRRNPPHGVGDESTLRRNPPHGVGDESSLRRNPPHAVSASRAIRRLEWLAEINDWQHNNVFLVISLIFLGGTHLAWAIESWRRRHGASIRQWLEAVGEFEALASLSAYRYEHPDDPFPEVAAGTARFEGTSLGHPLLPAARMVRNDVALDDTTRLLVISGSNMSGKSTLLRTVGTNAVLAFAGAPVRAASLRLSPLAIGATLRIQDSLLEGRSRFYAEITRIRELADVARGPRTLLFLLDEMFHGTNSHDRLVGATGVLRSLLDRGAIGLITTHDLALTAIAGDLGTRAANVHFEEWFDGGEMRFDYRLKPGRVTRSNALALMRAVGLEVDTDG